MVQIQIKNIQNAKIREYVAQRPLKSTNTFSTETAVEATTAICSFLRAKYMSRKSWKSKFVKTGKKCFDKLHFNEGVVRSTRQFCSAGTLPSSDGGFDEGNLIKDGDRDQCQRQSKMNTGKTRLQRDQKFQSWMGRDVSFPESGTGLA